MYIGMYHPNTILTREHFNCDSGMGEETGKTVCAVPCAMCLFIFFIDK